MFNEKVTKRLWLLILAAALVLPSIVSAATWEIDPDHTTIGFSVRHMMISNVKGVFNKFSAKAVLDDADMSKSTFTASIETASIDTKIEKRDTHLKSADFFDAAKYPTMAFVSKKVTPEGKDALKIVGDLTIKGTTKEVTLAVEGLSAPVKDPMGNIRRGCSVTAKINRKDFGLTWNKALETGGVMVGEDVSITLEVEMIKK
ncbi:MAG: YceI family protein [Candidatus Magnetominusculus sp. LBB02]|nr:YceI family protein [Candidatus Magnetominusculus sp. LBB02]